MKFDIIEYMGKFEGGIITLISLAYEDEYYDATFFYNDEFITLTPDEKLEEELGCIIEEWDGYNQLVLDILDRVVPHNELINSLDEIDITEYNEGDTD